MMKSNVSDATPETKPSSNLSRVRSVEIPDSRDVTSPKAVASSYNAPTMAIPRPEFEMDTPRPPLPGIQSPMDALRISMASPFRNFLGLLKPPPLPIVGGSSGLHGGSSDPESPRGSTDSVESLDSGRLTLSSGSEDKLYATRREGQNLVLVAFDANVKEISHTGIVWAMEHILKRGDILAIVSVLDTVRGALGYRVKIGDPKWVSANQKLIEDEVQQKMEVWRTFPGLDRRCGEGGVTLVVTVKAAQRGEFAIAKEAMKLGACHVVLDKSLSNRHRRFYLQNLACNVTRMRRSGGVDVIRPIPEPRSPTSVIPPPLLSYGDQIDEFEISLNPPKPKRLTLKLSPPVASPSKYPMELNSQFMSPESQLTPTELQLKSEDFRRLSSSAILATAHERSSSISQSTTTTSTTTHDRPSSASTPSLRESLTSSSTATDNNDMDDDLFSICHGSTRHTDVDADLFTIPNHSSGYESDDLFSIGNASTRPLSPPLERPSRHIHHHSLSIPDTSELVITEPLRQATISRITFVVGMGDSVTLTLRSPLLSGEGLLVGSSPSALFLMHTDHHQDRTATLSTATPNSYIAMEGKMAMKLSFLEPGQGVLAVDSFGRGRTVRVENAGAHKKPLVLVEAQCEGKRHGVLLHHTDTVGSRHSHSQSWGGAGDNDGGRESRSVKGLTVGDRVLLRLRSAEPSHAIWSS